MSAIPPLLEGKQTLGELPENDAHDPERTSPCITRDFQSEEPFHLRLSTITP